uniref:Uncharacterized protein n=1 Tax=Nothobranchius furzeri TaxID=105023 RepID=A0A8C6PFM6_NOTFU
MACDALAASSDMQIYWRKVKGHSRAPGTDKDLNDLADSLAKQGATDGTPWSFNPLWLPDNVSSWSDPPRMCVVTRAQAAHASTSQPSDGFVSVQPVFSENYLVSLQSQDPAISRMILYLSDPTAHLPSSVELDSVPELCALFRVECLPAPNDMAQTTAILLMNHIFSWFGLPERVNSDRGTHFTSGVMEHLWRMLGVKANFHIGYRPQSSGQVERMNRTVVSILRTYVSSSHRDWDMKLPLVLMAIWATPHESTGVSPFEMMTGRQMTLPLHLLYQAVQPSAAPAYTRKQYLQDLKNHLPAAFSFEPTNLEKSAEGWKAYYDQKASHSELNLGDEASFYIFATNSGHTKTTSGKLTKKLLPKWSGPYLKTEKLSPVVFQMKITDGNKDPIYKWVHWNQIKPHKGSTVLDDITTQDCDNPTPIASKGG